MLITEADFAKHFVVLDPQFKNLGRCPNVLLSDYQAVTVETVGAVRRFRDFLDNDFRQWCSPGGIAAAWAPRLIEKLDEEMARDA